MKSLILFFSLISAASTIQASTPTEKEQLAPENKVEAGKPEEGKTEEAQPEATAQ